MIIETPAHLRLGLSEGYGIHISLGTFTVYNVRTENFGSYGSSTARQWSWKAFAWELQEGPGKYSLDGEGSDKSPMEQVHGEGIFVTISNEKGGSFPVGFWNANINPPSGTWMACESKNGELVACKFALGVVTKKTMFGTKQVRFENTYATLDRLHYDIMQACEQQGIFQVAWARLLRRMRAAQGVSADGRL